MIKDLKADSKRWDEELRRNQRRGFRPGIYNGYDVALEKRPNSVPAYADTEIHERRQITGPTQTQPAYSGSQGRRRERDEYDVDDYGRPIAPQQRSLFQSSMTQDYPSNYPATTGGFQNPSMVAPSDYVLARGQAADYGQVPRSEYDMYAAANPGRGAPIQAPPQGQFAGQQSMPSAAPYRDPRTGQMIYPTAAAGRSYEQPPRHTSSADGRFR
jgi:hypothetical protein